jgi:ribosomal protein S27AE
MPKRSKMICPDCGVEMNHHANKLDYTSALDEPEAIDESMGGIVQEAHTCPQCGQTALRQAEDQGETG